jgi:cytochrome oxidase assembly protein ShyY1
VNVDEPDEPLFRVPQISAGTARQGLALLGTRRWLIVLLGVVVLSVGFVELGRWQYHRHEGKVARRDLVRDNYQARPRPVAEVLGALPLAERDTWSPVTATGRYEPASQLLVRNRVLDGKPGFHVLVPLRLDSGEVLVIDRGWVPAGRTSAEPPVGIPTPPAGEVTVTARLRPFEPVTRRPAPVGQVPRIDRTHVVDALARAGVNGTVLGGYGVVAQESPAPDESPARLPRPDTDLGVHLAYAYQWWIFAALLFLVLAVALYREAERAESSSATPGTAGPRTPLIREGGHT